MWQTPDVVARAGLDGLAKNKAVVIPGVAYRIVGNITKVSPHAITRRLAGAVMRRTLQE